MTAAEDAEDSDERTAEVIRQLLGQAIIHGIAIRA
jgi:hypothetical protein